MGTSDGIRTRRYHALLVAAMASTGRRVVLVADLEVHVETSAGRFALTSHRYRGDVIYPDGVTRLVAFSAEPWPAWRWAVQPGLEVTCEVVVEPGASRVALRWTAHGPGRVELWVRPLLAARHFHALQREGPWWSNDVAIEAGATAGDAVKGATVMWRPYAEVAICARTNGQYTHQPDWYRNVVYSIERERGLDHEEDLASPGVFTFNLAAPALLAFGRDPVPDNAFGAFDREWTRRTAAALDRAADSYLIVGNGGPTVIAGYPWFGDWGRDTFIALRGLCLARNRRDIAREILLAWAPRVSQGMLPNRYSDDDATPEYNSVDAALWFIIATDAYERAGAVAAADRRLLGDAIDAIVSGYSAGTRHRIAVADDGLLACGEPGVQLTWMDAKAGGDVITPRIGKPVEVQALWLNALAIAARRRDSLRAPLERGAAAFAARFWDAERGQLYDVVDCDHVPNAVDASCRPNQLLALGGLPLVVIDLERARIAVDTCERQLWTAAGPRTLAPTDPRYCGHYRGGPVERDRCYHNGPVWPWLAGPFIDAWLHVRGNTAAARREARVRFVEPLLARAQGGHLPELYDGDPPHRAAGAPFQAWSVAELIRLEREVR